MSSDLTTAETTLPSKQRSTIRSWLMDMDGVLVHEEQIIPGADRFLGLLRERELPFLVLTGVTSADDVDRFTYRPSRVVNSIAELTPELETSGGEADAGAGSGG